MSAVTLALAEWLKRSLCLSAQNLPLQSWVTTVQHGWNCSSPFITVSTDIRSETARLFVTGHVHYNPLMWPVSYIFRLCLSPQPRFLSPMLFRISHWRLHWLHIKNILQNELENKQDHPKKNQGLLPINFCSFQGVILAITPAPMQSNCSPQWFSATQVCRRSIQIYGLTWRDM